MNCFNIREVQSLLKRKFFVDLINSKDQRTFLNTSALGVRFKSESLTSINSNTINFYFYGPDLDLKIRNVFYSFDSIDEDISQTLKFNLKSFFYKILTYFSKSNLFHIPNSILFLITDLSATFFNFNKIFNLISFIFFKILYLLNRTYMYTKFLILLISHSVFTAFSYVYYIVDSFFYYVARAIIIFFFVVGRASRRIKSFFIKDFENHILTSLSSTA